MTTNEGQATAKPRGKLTSETISMVEALDVSAVNSLPDSKSKLRFVAMHVSLFVLFTVFAMCVAGGDWISVAIITAAFFGLALLSRGIYCFTLVWIVGMPTLFVFPDRFLNAIPGLNTGRIMFVAIVFSLMLSRVFRLRPAIRIHRVEVWSFLFLAIAFISLLSHLPSESVASVKASVAMYLQGYLMPLGAFSIALCMDWSQQRVKKAIFFLTVMGVFLAIIAILQQHFGVTLFNPHHIQVINEGRASGTLGSSHEFGAVVTALLILALLQAIHGCRTQGAATFYLLAAAFMGIALILTKTRGPWLAAMVAFAFLFAHDKRVRPLLIFGALFGAAAGFILLIVIVDSDLWNQRLGEVSPIYNRLTAYATSINAILHNPFLGMGFTDTAFEKAKAGYISNAGPISAYWVTNVGVPHNEFFHLGLLTGVPGLIVYLLIIGQIHKSLSNIRRTADDHFSRWFALYVNAMLLCFVINALLVDFSLSTYFPIMLYFLAGTAIRYGESEASMMQHDTVYGGAGSA